MKIVVIFAGLIIFGAGLVVDSCAGQDSPDAGARLKLFGAEKEKQGRLLAAGTDSELPHLEFQAFFSAVQDGNWQNISNNYFEIKDIVNTDPVFHKSWWQTVVEVFGAEEQFRGGDEKYFSTYANDIIQSIPPGSIYFGGTDPGRFVISAMQKSQVDGDPFFTLTQNALADITYLDYLRSTYGAKIYIPTAEDSQRCFNDYYADVKERAAMGRLEPGEDVATDPETGKMRVSGQVAVMNVNALLVKVILDKETNREFYIEESFPLAWMYPHLEPHGLIFKLNHEPLDGLTDEMVQRDHDYWTKTVAPIIGDWLDDDTTVADIAAFSEKVFLQHDFSSFTGDTNFVLNSHAHDMFSKERSSSAGLYAWRANHTDDNREKQRMNDEADLAFRQAWAMCPDLPEVVFRYAQFLMSAHRIDDAIIVVRTGLEVSPQNVQIADLLKNLENIKRQSGNLPRSQSQINSMENEARANPTDYTNIFSLAGYYIQMKQTNQAAELMQDAISRPGVPLSALRAAAQFFAQTSDFPRLETALEKITVADPQSPETFYDLARLEAHLGENDEALKNLQTAIELSDQRLQTNSRALNIRAVASEAIEFSFLRSSPDFQKLISQ